MTQILFFHLVTPILFSSLHSTSVTNSKLLCKLHKYAKNTYHSLPVEAFLIAWGIPDYSFQCWVSQSSFSVLSKSVLLP